MLGAARRAIRAAFAFDDPRAAVAALDLGAPFGALGALFDAVAAAFVERHTFVVHPAAAFAAADLASLPVVAKDLFGCTLVATVDGDVAVATPDEHTAERKGGGPQKRGA